MDECPRWNRAPSWQRPRAPRGSRAPGPGALALGLARTVVALVWLGLGASLPAMADEVSAPGAGIWLVSSRKVPADCASPPDPTTLCVARRTGPGQWQPETLETLAAALAGDTALVQIHGNNTTADDAPGHGLWIREQLFQARGGCLPGQWVIWSWPSDRLPGSIRNNVRVKADVAEWHAWYLAWWLGTLDETSRVGLLGHSYGARMATAAMHLIGGGSIEGVAAPLPPDQATPPARLALTGAALDDDWLVPGRRHGLALTASEQTLVVTNPADSVLKLYPRLYGRGGPLALGSWGVRREAGVCLPLARLVEWDVSSWVGAGHVSKRYLMVPQVARCVADFLTAEQDCLSLEADGALTALEQGDAESGTPTDAAPPAPVAAGDEATPDIAPATDRETHPRGLTLPLVLPVFRR